MRDETNATWVQITAEELAHLKHLANLYRSRGLKRLVNKITDAQVERTIYAGQIAEAAELVQGEYDGAAIAVDPNAPVSANGEEQGGVWVGAWVWIEIEETDNVE